MAGPAEFVTCDQTIERGVNRLKQWRAVTFRFDKRGLNYRAGVVLAAVMLWLLGCV